MKRTSPEMHVLFLVVTIFVAARGFHDQSLEKMDLEKSYPQFQPEPIPVEVQFITQKDQTPPGDTQVQYHASLCGGCYFDNLTARFAVNLANNPWRVDSGDYVTVTAKDTAGNVVGTNVVGGVPGPDFNFTYFAKYKDLFFDVKTGPAPAFVYTLSLSFAYNTSVKRALPCEPRWQITPVEHDRFQNFSKGDESGHLEPIFITHAKKVVNTTTLLYLRLDYCFGASHQYNITITTVADDQKSGFATYACKKTYNGGKCNVLTPFRDISGGPANFIEMTLDGPQDYGPVVVIVRGDGRYQQPNSFILSASAPY